jgi:hypothetical protein
VDCTTSGSGWLAKASRQDGLRRDVRRPASWRPPGEGWQLPPEEPDDEAKRQLYAAHRRRRRVPISSLVALVVLVAVVAGLAALFALHLL